ncbi:MAG: undecaprenyl-diphosphate phosphatase [Acidobacteria bacterium]|nr:undecaprenyl-diphosphate phosphatase [Acidobacteriota bacterium]MCH8985914.1 undecaprenyl-diphosphate phosphatase [Acidobacteriota bacterium]
MLDAIIWGLTQGLTEFLPVSSSGHLVLVPALLGRPSPDLATAAFLHLGTLVAVLIYFRVEVGQMLRLTHDGRKMLKLVAVGTIPAAVIGLLFRGALGRFVESPRAVAVSMLLLGMGLLSTRFIATRERKVADLRVPDAVAIGLAQAVALIPGVSRSGTTIAAAMMRGVDKAEAARFSFLLGIPAIAGAGLIETIDLTNTDAGITLTMAVGVLVAGVSGYLAIAGLLSLIRRTGLVPFGAYCIGFATLSLIVL